LKESWTHAVPTLGAPEIEEVIIKYVQGIGLEAAIFGRSRTIMEDCVRFQGFQVPSYRGTALVCRNVRLKGYAARYWLDRTQINTYESNLAEKSKKVLNFASD